MFANGQISTSRAILLAPRLRIRRRMQLVEVVLQVPLNFAVLRALAFALTAYLQDIEARSEQEHKANRLGCN